MTIEPLFDTFIMLFAIGLALSIGTLVMVLVVDYLGERRSTLPRATARQM